MNKHKKYSLVLLSVCICGLIPVAGLTIFVDPYFHYRLPNKNLSYRLSNERYQNDGIMRHWDYDAMIVGTSMTENFKTSELDSLFLKNSIKVPFSGASYKEINDNINRAIKYNSNLDMVVRAIDCSLFYTSSDHMRYDESFYPEYLTNENILDDVYYLLNKRSFKDSCTILLTFREDENTITNFDDAYNWNDYYTFGKEAVLASYSRTKATGYELEASEEEIARFKENIEKNIVETIRENPGIEFYYFLTPYSICYWDDLNQKGSMEKHLTGERMVIEALLPFDNVYLFSFSNDFSLTTDLNNYKDIAHYGENVNSYMLTCMKNGDYRLTKENYEEYLSNIKSFYENYDYEALFE